jgi:hypothetical protein
MAEIVMEVDLKTGSAIKNAGDLQDSIQDVDKETKNVTESTQEMGNQLDSVTGGAITKFKGLTGTLKKVVGSFKTLKGAIIATGIGALVIAVTSLTQAFTASETGQNRLAKVLKQFGVIAGNVGDIFYSLGDTIYNVITGNFDEAGKAFDRLKERVTNFGDETKRELELAGELADKIADADKRERELLVERSQTNVKINELKTKAAEVDKFTSEQRIQFLEQAAALEDEITGKEVALAELRRDIKIEENSLSESSKEDLDDEAQLIANVIQLEEQRLLKNKELLGVAAGLRKMEADKLKAEREKELADFQKQQDDISGILKNSITKNNDFVISSEKDINDKLKGLLKTKAKEEKQIDKLTTEDKVNLASNALGNLSSIMGEESKAGKAAAIAQTTIETYKGATSAYSSLAGIPIVGPALGGIAAAAAVVAGMKNIQAIQQIGPPVSAPSATPRGAQPPRFNIIGAAPENQLAQAIGDREQKPVKAYVVSNEVTTQQALDRNIERSASIG